MEPTSLRSIIVPVIALVVIVIGIGYVIVAGGPTVPTPEAVSSSTPPTTATTPPPTAPSPAPTTNGGTAAPSAPTTKDGMAVSAITGTVPFNSAFTLTLNTNHACSPSAYTLDFGDNITQTVQVPLDDCKKTFSTTVNHQYTRAGTYTARLITKPVGKTGVTLSEATITGKNPVVTSGTGSIKFTTSPISGKAPLSVEFTMLTTDSSESTGVYYTIVFGDGQIGTFPRTSFPVLTHVFATQGSYLVSVSRRTQCAKGTCAGPSAALGNITITVN